MKIKSFGILMLGLLLALSLCAQAQEPEWMVKFTSPDVATLGTHPDSTPGFDLFDNPAPLFIQPPWAVFIIDDPHIPFDQLKKDIRPLPATWELKVISDNVFNLSWEVLKGPIPEGVPLSIVAITPPIAGVELPINMKEISSIEGIPAGIYTTIIEAIPGGPQIEILSPIDGAIYCVSEVVDVIAEVKDSDGQPIVGQEVTFESTCGTVDPAIALTDENGLATTQLTVYVVGPCDITATITTDEGEVSDTVTIIVEEPKATTVEIISPEDGATFCVGEIVDVVAKVRDQFANPMAGVEVTFSAIGGAVFPTSGLTDTNGQTTTLLTVAQGGNTVTAAIPGDTDTVTVIGVADVSGDGKITAYDASLVLRYVVGLTDFEIAQRQAADVTGDGTITALDAALILQYTVGSITQFLHTHQLKEK